MIIILIIAIVFIFFLIKYSIDWLVHRDMTTDNCKKWGYGSYKQFLIQYNKIQWEPNDMTYNCAKFSNYPHSQIHAGIIKFNDKGMVINYLEYWRVLLLMKAWKKNKTLIEWEKK